MRSIQLSIAVGLLVLASTAAASPLRYASWNMERTGGSNLPRNMGDVAKILRQFDFISIQQVRSVKAVTNIRNALDKTTSVDWQALVSQPEGNTHAMRYAFLWRTSKVAYKEHATVYIDDSQSFSQPPFSALFTNQSDDKTLIASTIHIRDSKNSADRTREIKALPRYWRWLNRNFQNLPIVLSGDFNANPHNKAFNGLTQMAVPLIQRGRSTLAQDHGYAHLYDNIWVSRAFLSSMPTAGIYKYLSIMKVSNSLGRRTISDHAPVFAIMDIGISN